MPSKQKIERMTEDAVIRAMHKKLMQTSPDYQAAFQRVIAEVFTELAEAKLLEEDRE
jgi:hypothetical protein